MATTRKRRRVVPGVLIATGIAGLGLAAASQLDLNWSGTFQDGVVPVTADCQPTDQPITVSFSDPAFASGSATTSPWTVSSLEFTGIADRSEGTRLNSSHVAISYAVFCLKKK